MSRLLLFVVFFAVVFDFATPDAALLVTGARILQSDDEEDSVPSRRQRVGEGEQRVAVFKVAPGSIEKQAARPSTEPRAHVDRASGYKTWRLPFKHTPTSSVRSSSSLSPDAH